MPISHEFESSVEPAKNPVKELFKQDKFNDLLAKRDNPDAQLAGLSLLLGPHRLDAKYGREALSTLNIGLVGKTLGIESDFTTEFEKEVRPWLKSSEDELDRLNHYIDVMQYSRNDNAERRQEWEEAQQEALDIRGELAEFDHWLFPLREKILTDPKVPQEYKIKVIQGMGSLNSYGNYDKLKDVYAEEDQLLKGVFESKSTPPQVKKAIAETAKSRLNRDPDAFTIADLPAYEQAGVDLDKLMCAVAGSRYVDADFIQKEFAPKFFPNRDPNEVRKAWEVLAKATHNDVDRKHQFFTEGSNFNTVLMNRKVFEQFMDLYPSIGPLVGMMSEFGFNYMPFRYGEKAGNRDQYWPEFIDGLEVLGGDVEGLKTDLVKLKEAYPYFKYEWDEKKFYSAKEQGTVSIVENNPYSICFKQQILDQKEWGLLQRSPVFQMQTVAEAGKFIAQTPEKWRDGVMREYVSWIWQTLSRPRFKREEVLTAAIKGANIMMLSPNMSEETRGIVAKGYFQTSLMPESKNIGPLFDYIQKHQGGIEVNIDGEKRIDQDAVWYEFVMKAGDVYRYNLGGPDEAQIIALARQDLDYAQQGLSRIGDLELRDKAAEQLVYAFTDIDYRDLDTARTIAGTIHDEYTRSQAEETIRLEAEREQRGEKSSWKILERAKRVSKSNKNYLADLLGFGTAQTQKIAREEFYKRTGHINIRSAQVEPSEESMNRYGREVARIQGQVGVTINMDWEGIKGFLDEGKVRSIWDNQETLQDRNQNMSYHYGDRREEIERKLGNKAKGSARDPHPIYGALFSPNGRDEFFGAALRYGVGFVKLKNSKIDNRTTVTYDDSFNVFSDFPMSWEEATETKAMMNVLGHQTAHGYAEAQILGGVVRDDGESITIPRSYLEEIAYNKGSKEALKIEKEIEEYRQKYPQIPIIINEEANSAKLLEVVETHIDAMTMKMGYEDHLKKIARASGYKIDAPVQQAA